MKIANIPPIPPEGSALPQLGPLRRAQSPPCQRDASHMNFTNSSWCGYVFLIRATTCVWKFASIRFGDFEVLNDKKKELEPCWIFYCECTTWVLRREKVVVMEASPLFDTIVADLLISDDAHFSLYSHQEPGRSVAVLPSRMYCITRIILTPTN